MKVHDTDRPNWNAEEEAQKSHTYYEIRSEVPTFPMRSITLDPFSGRESSSSCHRRKFARDPSSISEDGGNVGLNFNMHQFLFTRPATKIQLSGATQVFQFRPAEPRQKTRNNPRFVNVPRCARGCGVLRPTPSPFLRKTQSDKARKKF